MANIEHRSEMPGSAQPRKFDLEDRLVDFSVLMLKVADALPKTYAGQHLSGQLTRSGTSPALNYGEAQSGESRKDFIHKVKICLKELRESRVCLKIIDHSGLLKDHDLVKQGSAECNELTAIFVKSVRTAEANLRTAK
ncbi:MAG: four helix bundle protein [Flavobacteriales bacterium]